MIARLWVLITVASVSFGAVAATLDPADCDNVNGSQNETLQFTVTGPSDDQYFNLLKSNRKNVVRLWAAKKQGSGIRDDYLFEVPVTKDDGSQEAELEDNAAYEIRITSAKSGNSDTFTYYRRQIHPVVTSWEKIKTKTVSKAFSGRHEAEGSISATYLQCGDGVQDPTDAPEPTPPPFGPSESLCEYFPQPAQGWASGSKLTLKANKNGQISDYAYHIGGWTGDYWNNHTRISCEPKGQASCANVYELATGFDSVAYSAEYSNLHWWGGYATSCEASVNGTSQSGRCINGSSSAESPPEITPNFAASVGLTLESSSVTYDGSSRQYYFARLVNGELWKMCLSDGSDPYCHVTEDGSGNILLTIKSDLKTLDVQGTSDSKMIVNFEPGSSGYGRMVEQYTVGGNVETRFSQSGLYTFRTLSFSSDTEIKTGNSVKWLITESMTFNNSLTHQDSGNPDDLIIYAPNSDSSITVRNIVNPLHALVVSESVEFTNDFTLIGAVTSNDLIMHTANSAIVGNSQCFTSEVVADYGVAMTPQSALTLMCGNEHPEFSVTTTNNEVAESLSVTASLSSDDPSADESELGDIFAVTVANGVGSGAYPSFTSNVSGALDLQVSVTDIDRVALDTTYTLTVTMDEDNSTSVSSKFKYVPHKFELVNAVTPNTVYVTANKPEEIKLQLLACDEDSNVQVATNYSGTPSVSHRMVEPSGGVSGVLTYAPDFSDDSGGDAGTTSDSLTITESGSITVNLTDSFDCSGLLGCPDDGSADVTGSFTVQSRPWTFAICDSETDYSNSGGEDKMDGNITNAGSSGYKVAGEAFGVKVYPIVWLEDRTKDNGYLDVSTYCDDLANDSDNKNSNLTADNFFSDGVGLTLTHQVSQPDNSNAANGTLSGERTFGYAQNEDGKDYYLTELKWSEVGVLRLQVEPDAQYLGMDIDSSYREIGRFYPSYIAVTDDSWTYAAGHSGFAYMNQPIGHAFVVEAKNADGNSVANYRWFDSELIVDLNYYAQTLTGTDLNARIAKAGSDWVSSGDDWTLNSDSGVAQLVFSSDSVEFRRTEDTAKAGATTPDGPYLGTGVDGLSANTAFGVKVTASPDGVAFKDGATEQLFTNQPDFLYGRMKLTDVGGNSGTTISVPLQVQYWTGSAFVTNSHDSGSQFDVADYCQETIWHSKSGSSSDASYSLVSGSDAPLVAGGEFDNLIASHSGGSREQVRLWLRLDSSEPNGADSCEGAVTALKAQPWLRYNWRDIEDEDPSAVVVFGTYRGNDRVIFRGESRMFGQ